MAQYEHILFEVREGVAWVTLNRPEKLNAVNPLMRTEIFDAIDTIRGESEIRAAVITGSGRGFCTGADISARDFPSPREGDPDNMLHGRTSDLRWGWHRILRLMWETEKPIIAAVNGWAVGFGCHLALYSDLIIASEDARFMEPWAARGLPVEAGGAYILPRIMPLHRAKEMVFFAEPILAAEALTLGMVNRVVPAADLMATAEEWAARLAKSATRVIGIHKRQLQMSLDSTMDRSMYDEVTMLPLVHLAEDSHESMAAYQQKRDPRHTGR